MDRETLEKIKKEIQARIDLNNFFLKNETKPTDYGRLEEDKFYLRLIEKFEEDMKQEKNNFKAWFVFKDGQQVGNVLGYKSERAAKLYINECEDSFNQWDEYITIKYGEYNGAVDIPQELRESGIFVQKFSDILDRWGWFVSYPVWEKNVWKPYVKEHYKIEEKKYKIVFED